jgi:hypothetical protein
MEPPTEVRLLQRARQETGARQVMRQWAMGVGPWSEVRLPGVVDPAFWAQGHSLALTSSPGRE